MTRFYKEILLLEEVARETDSVTLGKNGTPLVFLRRGEHLPSAPSGSAGLYHFALVHSSRGDLARTVAHIIKSLPQTFSGSADHLVSEAFYFTDPEGNGIELYFDRDRSEWEWTDGRVRMASVYIDPAEYIRTHGTVREEKSRTQMGHVHLKVGDTESAKQFYSGVLGFDVTAELPGAVFISADGYHHHIGLNTWESGGAGKRNPSAGLKEFFIHLAERHYLDGLKLRLTKHAVPFEESEGALRIRDPWNNTVVFSIPPESEKR
jgi:catechol 2,3-dioxygenase